MATRAATASKDAEVVAAAIATFDPDLKQQPLAAKLARISGFVGSIEKKGFNKVFQYKFIQEGDLVSALRPYLAEAGITIIPSIINHEMTEQGTSRSGNVQYLTTLHVEFTITDGVTEYTGSAVGYGQDNGDKGVYKAMTGANKYFLMKLFQIDSEDDPEHDRGTNEPPEAPRAPVITQTSAPKTGKGGHAAQATDTQYNLFVQKVRDGKYDLAKTLVLFQNVVHEIPADQTAEGVKKFFLARTSEEAGAILRAFGD